MSIKVSHLVYSVILIALFAATLLTYRYAVSINAQAENRAQEWGERIQTLERREKELQIALDQQEKEHTTGLIELYDGMQYLKQVLEVYDVFFTQIDTDLYSDVVGVDHTVDIKTLIMDYYNLEVPNVLQ